MKKYILISLLVFSCKGDKKESNADQNLNQEQNIENEAKTFENSLIDLRDVDQEFIEGYKVSRFGVRKENDSTYFFALKLDENTTKEVVETYSVGARAFNSESEEKTLVRGYSPNLELRDNDKYLLLKVLPTNWKYMDSIDFYIYARKDWKASGRLGGVKIRDVLIEK